METKESMLKWSQRENTKQHQASGRVRLRYRVGHQKNSCDNHPESENTNALSSKSQVEVDSLQGWSIRARIPPAISHKSKLLGYVLMAQTTFADPAKAIRKHFTNDVEIASNILANQLRMPQASAVIEFLHLLTCQVPDFPELRAFSTECFVDFSYTDSKDLAPLNYLRLYIASYQNNTFGQLYGDISVTFSNTFLAHLNAG